MNLEGLTEKKNHMGTIYYEDDAGVIVAKVCGKCKEIKELSNYGGDKRKLGGKSSTCKACKAAVSRIRYTEKKDHILEKCRIWREDNIERRSELNRIWREDNKERLGKYRENNKERQAESVRDWKQGNRSRVTASEQRRRARKAMLPNTLTSAEYEDACKYFEGCALTGENDHLNLEHAIPIAIGHGGTTEANCYPLRADLNFSKNDRNIFEWFEANRQRFNLSQARFDRLIEWIADKNEMSTEEYRKYVDWCHDNPRELISTEQEAVS